MNLRNIDQLISKVLSNGLDVPVISKGSAVGWAFDSVHNLILLLDGAAPGGGGAVVDPHHCQVGGLLTTR